MDQTVQRALFGGPLVGKCEKISSRGENSGSTTRVPQIRRQGPVSARPLVTPYVLASFLSPYHTHTICNTHPTQKCPSRKATRGQEDRIRCCRSRASPNNPRNLCCACLRASMWPSPNGAPLVLNSPDTSILLHCAAKGQVSRKSLEKIEILPCKSNLRPSPEMKAAEGTVS